MTKELSNEHPPSDSSGDDEGTLGGSCLIHIKSLLLECSVSVGGRGRRGNWKCPPRIYGVRNGEPGAGRTLGGEGTEKGGEGEFKLEEEKLGGEILGCRKILRR